MWKGRLGFGLIGCDVKMYKAVDAADSDLHLMHTACGGGRVRYLYKCEKCEAVEEKRPTERGYEYSKGQYVILTEADLASLPLKTLHEIEVVGFTADRIDPRATADSFYLAPEKGSANLKPFQLIYAVMEKLGVKAVGKVAVRGREHPCVVSAFDGVMLVQTLCYSDEIRDFSEIRAEGVALSEKELELGETLVKQMMIAFDHCAFRDEYRHALEALVEAKLAGREVVAVGAAPAPAGDLVEQLLASIGIKG